MPELPEVETTRLGIVPHLVGKQVQQVILRRNSLRYPLSAQLQTCVEGKTLAQIQRRAKYLLLFFQEGGGLLIHLGMSGSLRIVNGAQREVIKKHDHIDWLMSDGTVLRYHDPRRFGFVLWSQMPQHEQMLINLGPEPLSDDFNARLLYQQSRGRKVSIKPFIMDQKVVVGVGNIYASEALFLAGIHPKRKASQISLARYIVLVEKIKKILTQAIKQGGTTLKDFVNSDGNPGYFQQQLLVYGRGGEACRVCASVLKDVRLGQRSSVFCAQCQR